MLTLATVAAGADAGATTIANMLSVLLLPLLEIWISTDTGFLASWFCHKVQGLYLDTQVVRASHGL